MSNRAISTTVARGSLAACFGSRRPSVIERIPFRFRCHSSNGRIRSHGEIVAILRSAFGLSLAGISLRTKCKPSSSSERPSSCLATVYPFRSSTNANWSKPNMICCKKPAWWIFNWTFTGNCTPIEASLEVRLRTERFPCDFRFSIAELTEKRERMLARYEQLSEAVQPLVKAVLTEEAAQLISREQ